MPDEPATTFSSSLTTDSQPSAVSQSPSAQSIIQSLLQIYGFPQLDAKIQDAAQQEQQASQQLRSVIEQFAKQPNASSRDQLVRILAQEFIIVQKRREDANEQRKFYQREAKQAVAQAESAQGLSWLTGHIIHGVKNFFGSTAAQQAEKYQATVEQYSAHINALREYLTDLNTLDFDHSEEQSAATVFNEVTTTPPAATTTPVFPPVISLATLDSQTGFTISSESTDMDKGIGQAVSAGDINHDGYSDLVVGAPGSNAGVGRVYVVPGGKNLGQTGEVMLTPGGQITIDGEVPFGQATGAAVSVVSDDKNPAILIGASDSYGYTGFTYWVPGGSQFNQSGNWTLPFPNGAKFIGETFDDFSGLSVGSVGPGFLVGAPGYGGADATGRGYVIDSSTLTAGSVVPLASLNGSAGYKITTAVKGGLLGSVMMSGGDFNGDGHPDTVITAPDDGAGSVHVIFGGPDKSGEIALDNPDGVTSMVIKGAQAGEKAGWAVTYIQPPGSGPSTLVIGAPLSNKQEGCLYIVPGGDYGSQLSLQGWGLTIRGEEQGDKFGYAVGNIGKMAGDDTEHLGVGAIGHNQGSGRTYVWPMPAGQLPPNFNLSEPHKSGGFVVDGAKPGDGSGFVVTGGGDLCGDGKASVLIGAATAERVYAVFGLLGITPAPPTEGDDNKRFLPLLSLLSLLAIIPCVMVAKSEKLKRHCTEYMRHLGFFPSPSIPERIATGHHEFTNEGKLSQTYSAMQIQNSGEEDDELEVKRSRFCCPSSS